MKKEQITVGETYTAKVSNKVVTVRITQPNPRGGWMAINTATGKEVRIKTAQRLRSAVSESRDKAVAKAMDKVRTMNSQAARGLKPYKASPTAANTPASNDDASAAQTEVTNPAPSSDPFLDDLNNLIAKAEGKEPPTDVATDGPAPDDAGATTPPAKPARGGGRKKKSVMVDPAGVVRLSALDAAAQVLRNATEPMQAKEIVKQMQEQNLWTSKSGRTPEATIYAAMIREIAAKGDQARFSKHERGRFTFKASA